MCVFKRALYKVQKKTENPMINHNVLYSRYNNQEDQRACIAHISLLYNWYNAAGNWKKVKTVWRQDLL